MARGHVSVDLRRLVPRSNAEVGPARRGGGEKSSGGVKKNWRAQSSAGGRLLTFRDTLQDDFAKRTIVHQMVQGFARLAKGIDSLDDRLDFSAHDQRDDVPPCGGDRSG